MRQSWTGGGGVAFLSRWCCRLVFSAPIAICCSGWRSGIGCLRSFWIEGLRRRGRPDVLQAERRRAVSAIRILRGPHPARRQPDELAVQFPAKFKWVVNLKTAKDMALDIPPTLRSRADEVIKSSHRLRLWPAADMRQIEKTK